MAQIVTVAAAIRFVAVTRSARGSAAGISGSSR
jgi:hypothetical protein